MCFGAPSTLDIAIEIVHDTTGIEKAHVTTGIENYRLGQQIGSGSFATVFAAEKLESTELLAIKMISKAEASRNDRGHCVCPFTEVNHLRSLRHPHVIQLFDFLETSESYYLVMERAVGKCLFDRVSELGGIPPREARRIFQQLISAVDHCHTRGIVHRDLKLDNILLDSEKNVKLADFGSSGRIRGNELMQTWCGSPEYVAPEIILHEAYQGPLVDVWSCGVVLYTMLCGKYPWGKGEAQETFRRIKQGDYAELGFMVPQPVKELISLILVVQPSDRITIGEIEHHSWFQQDLPEYLQTLSTTAKTASALSIVATERLTDASLQQVDRDDYSTYEVSALVPSFDAAQTKGCAAYEVPHIQPGGRSRRIRNQPCGRRSQFRHQQ